MEIDLHLIGTQRGRFIWETGMIRKKGMGREGGGEGGTSSWLGHKHLNLKPSVGKYINT